MSVAVPVGVCLGMSTGVLMRMSVKTTEEIEKPIFSNILIGLFGNALLFLGMRIRMLFGHTDTLISILFRAYPKPHFIPDYQKFSGLVFNDKKLNQLLRD
jgi:hypothetical protein